MFVGVGVMTALCAASYQLFVPETLNLMAAKVKAATATAEATATEPIGEKGDANSSPELAWYELDPGTKALLRDPQQRAVVTANAAMMFNYAGVLTILPLHATTVAAFGPLEIGALFSACSALGLVGGPLSGWLTDKLGDRVAVITPGLGVCAVGGLGMALANDPTTLVAAVFLWGAGEAIAGPAVAAYTADAAPDDQRGAALALSRSAGDAVFLVAPLAMGVMADVAGVGGLPLALMGVATAATAVYVPRAARHATWLEKSL
jgi:MFS family permease